ncbi:MAG: hypothetical protein U0946_07145, partial [Patescibacteria group bacterium]|nr:hypothetical protein [Patescibacteria group bacterium]
MQQLLDGYLSLAADATPVLEELAAVCDSATNDDADGREQHTDVANNRATSATMEALSNDGDGTQQGEGADAATTAMSEEDDASANPLASAHMYPSSFFSQRHSSMTPHALVQRSRNTCLTVFQLARAHLQHADRSDRNHRQHEMDLQRALDAEIKQRRSVESVLMSVDACARQSAQQLEHS